MSSDEFESPIDSHAYQFVLSSSDPGNAFQIPAVDPLNRPHQHMYLPVVDGKHLPAP